MEEVTCAEAADAVAELLVGGQASSSSFLLFRGHKLIEELDETKQSHEERAKANTSDMFLAISLRSLSVGSITLVVPTDSCSTDNERSSLDEEKQSPEQVENVESSNCKDPLRNIEVLEGVLMFASLRGSERVIAKSFQDPQSDEDDHNKEEKKRQEDDSTVR